MACKTAVAHAASQRQVHDPHLYIQHDNDHAQMWLCFIESAFTKLVCNGSCTLASIQKHGHETLSATTRSCMCRGAGAPRRRPCPYVVFRFAPVVVCDSIAGAGPPCAQPLKEGTTVVFAAPHEDCAAPQHHTLKRPS